MLYTVWLNCEILLFVAELWNIVILEKKALFKVLIKREIGVKNDWVAVVAEITNLYFISNINKGFERIWHAPIRIRTGREYNPRGLFEGSELRA